MSFSLPNLLSSTAGSGKDRVVARHPIYHEPHQPAIGKEAA